MRKALKVLIPLLLAAAMLAGACWFFLFYDRPLTAGLFLNGARSMIEKGRYERAITYYNISRRLTPDDAEISLELADAYRQIGNYTKAEYTLVSAISSNPSNFDLYTELSRTYVAQDKLLDAVQMLDRVSNPAVTAYLQEARPAAPSVRPESGYYTEYIQVTVEAAAPIIYCTTDGDFPSNAEDIYLSPVSLPSGETTFTAVSVNEAGLVSPAAVYGYTIGGVVEPVTLQDRALETSVREILKLEPSAEIVTQDLWDITVLDLPDTAADLSDLTYFTGLRSLSLHNVSGLDFSVLKNLRALETLDLSGCTISSGSLEAIGALHNLRTLLLDGCALTDLTALSSLTQLEELNLSNNSLTEVGVLSLMPHLKWVSLQNNPLTSIAGLSNCSALETLNINGCQITSIGSLSGKSALIRLSASDNQLSDISALAECTALEDLTISNNRITDISVLSHLPNLKIFEGSGNQISEIPKLDPDRCLLVRFSANYNSIEDISGLVGIHTLNYLALDYNQVRQLLPIVDNYNLIQINIWNNPLEDPEETVDAFEERSILVHYNPNYTPPDADSKE